MSPRAPPPRRDLPDPNRLPPLPLRVEEFLVETQAFDTEMTGVYIRLLAHLWVKGGEVRNDDRSLAVVAGLSLRRWRRLKPTILQCFTLAGDPVGATIVHGRLRDALERQRTRVEQARASGSRGGRATAERKRSYQAGEPLPVQQTPQRSLSPGDDRDASRTNPISLTREQARRAAERDCVAWLSAMMRASLDEPLRSKEDLLEEARGLWPGTLSARGFYRVWDQAIEDTGAWEWRRPGPRPKSPH